MNRNLRHCRGELRRRIEADAVRSSTRRKLLVVLGRSALLAPLASLAQQAGEPPRVGYLGPLYFDTFQRHMRKRGYVDRRNIVFERRKAKGQRGRIQEPVRVLVVTNNVGIEAARKATATLPVVMVSSIGPVAASYVVGLARIGRLSVRSRARSDLH